MLNSGFFLAEPLLRNTLGCRMHKGVNEPDQSVAFSTAHNEAVVLSPTLMPAAGPGSPETRAGKQSFMP